MEAPEQRSFELFVAAIREDREEIRLTRERIYRLSLFIAGADFAITAFLLGKDAASIPRYFGLFFAMDAMLVILMAVACWILMGNLRFTRIALEKRENDVIEMLKGKGIRYAYPDESARKNWIGTKKPSIGEAGLWFVPGLVLLAVAFKLVAIWRIVN